MQCTEKSTLPSKIILNGECLQEIVFMLLEYLHFVIFLRLIVARVATGQKSKILANRFYAAITAPSGNHYISLRYQMVLGKAWILSLRLLSSSVQEVNTRNIENKLFVRCITFKFIYIYPKCLKMFV